MSEIETMKVKTANADGYTIINAEDFDKSIHEPYNEEKPQPKKVSAAPKVAEAKLAEAKEDKNG